MQFDSVAEFLAMGGHGFYVWLAYGSTLAVLLSYRLVLGTMRRRLMRTLTWSIAAQNMVAAERTQEKDNESET